jgi:hypothetical protein
MRDRGRVFTSIKNRRAFLKDGMVAATLGGGLLASGVPAFGHEPED